ncbi:MAG: TolC family protein [Geothermobacteraceae bacterium]
MRLCRLVSRGLLCLAFVLHSAPLMAGEPDLPRSPLGQNYPLFQASLKEGNENELLATPDPEGDLSLEQALALTMRHNPQLAASAWQVEEKEGERRQSRLFPNPDIALEVENFAGEDDMSGFDAAETTLSVSQLLELGGKRGKRGRIADLERDLAHWDQEARRLDLLTEATKAYLDVVVAQQRVAQARSLAKLAHALVRAVRERVEAGKASPLEQTRAEVEFASAQLALARAERELLAARRNLGAFWGGTGERFTRATDDLKTRVVVPPFGQLEGLLQNSPELARWAAEMEKKKFERALAGAEAVPDLTLSLGVRTFQETNGKALVAGVEFPLPVFDRNQGGRQQATAAVYRARSEYESEKVRARAELFAAYQELRMSHDELLVLRKDLLPGAERAFEAANIGYREGKFSFLEMVDAQRTLFEVRGQYVDALARYHRSRITIERLIATPLELVTGKKAGMEDK